MHLAELNISSWKVDPLSPGGAGFTDNVSRINGLAERSDGFVWRLIDEQRDDKGRNAVCDGPGVVMTLSVWESISDLEHFVWNTVHKQIYNDKNQWFSEMESHHLVMWNVDAGHQPTLKEAKERLDYLDVNGDSDHAFGWSHMPM